MRYDTKEPRLWVCFEINTPIILNSAVLEFSLSAGHTASEVQIPSADIQKVSYITGMKEVMSGPESLYAFILPFT